MITCKKSFLEARCQERGWSLEEVMPCVVSRRGDVWTIDENHPAYPSKPKAMLKVTGGPGTELKALLRLVGITSSPNCRCNAHARQMDAWGPDRCEQEMPTILGWLEEQARGRGLPFVRVAARQVVKMAIRRARKKATEQGEGGT